MHLSVTAGGGGGAGVAVVWDRIRGQQTKTASSFNFKFLFHFSPLSFPNIACYPSTFFRYSEKVSNGFQHNATFKIIVLVSDYNCTKYIVPRDTSLNCIPFTNNNY